MATVVVKLCNQNALRELRMWHWRQALQCTRTLRSKLGNRSSKTRWRKAWKLHMGAVQCLNDYLPDTTAEQDCECENNPLVEGDERIAWTGMKE